MPALDFIRRAPPHGAVHIAEDIEKLAWRDILVGADAQLATSLQLEIEFIADALILRARGLDSLLFNRVIGLGTTETVADETIAAIARGYAQRGIRRYWIHACEHRRATDPCARLARYGFERYPRSWMKFLRDTAPFAARPSPLAIRPARDSDARAIADIVGPAFDLPPAGGEVFASLVGRPGWHIYVASDRDRIVAAGGLFVASDVGYHAFAATLPGDRNRGAQSLLMQERIRCAREHGCQWLATETGAPRSPDEPNPSYDNMLTCGFEPIGLRANYGLPGTKW